MGAGPSAHIFGDVWVALSIVDSVYLSLPGHDVWCVQLVNDECAGSCCHTPLAVHQSEEPYAA